MYQLLLLLAMWLQIKKLITHTQLSLLGAIHHALLNGVILPGHGYLLTCKIGPGLKWCRVHKVKEQLQDNVLSFSSRITQKLYGAYE